MPAEYERAVLEYIPGLGEYEDQVVERGLLVYQDGQVTVYEQLYDETDCTDLMYRPINLGAEGARQLLHQLQRHLSTEKPLPG